MTTITTFNLSILVFSKNRHPGQLHFTFFPPEKSTRLFVLNEVRPSPDRKIIKLLAFSWQF